VALKTNCRLTHSFSSLIMKIDEIPRCFMRWRTNYAGVAAILPTFIVICEAAGIGWPEAVGRLTAERSNAQICVAALKKYGDEGQVLRGRLTYGAAKSDFDGVITGLITALAEGGGPGGLPTFAADVERGATALKTVCKAAEELVAAKPGEKAVSVAQLQEAVEPLIKSIFDAVAAIYNYRSDKAATRLTIQTQLEAAKWPEFDDVKAAE
jgi:hypothetical protein